MYSSTDEVLLSFAEKHSFAAEMYSSFDEVYSQAAKMYSSTDERLFPFAEKHSFAAEMYSSFAKTLSP